ncbi:unnamed protein product [Protopolystoma xenopodis]|uniref:Uncharacterized protein n=1 Tax=Protopolystoma xenopodis TaxID=117903 RepID=A0A3S5C093_9PLAT|nr:unnamed protein product [Protopolystoma xenopodis]
MFVWCQMSGLFASGPNSTLSEFGTKFPIVFWSEGHRFVARLTDNPYNLGDLAVFVPADLLERRNPSLGSPERLEADLFKNCFSALTTSSESSVRFRVGLVDAGYFVEELDSLHPADVMRWLSFFTDAGIFLLALVFMPLNFSCLLFCGSSLIRLTFAESVIFNIILSA